MTDRGPRLYRSSRSLVLGWAVAAMVAAPVAAYNDPAGELSDQLHCLRITTGRYDAPGRDAFMPGLNGESIVIKNMCAAPQPLAGWSVRDADGQAYRFPESFALGADGQVRVHSGTGADTETHLYWGRTQGQVWNNVPPERAYLVDPSGAVASSWSIFQDRVLVGAGDIASCASGGDERTADLLDGIRGTVFTTGDNAYERGSATEYAECYDPSLGPPSRPHPSYAGQP